MSASACVSEPAQVNPRGLYSALLSAYLIRWYLKVSYLVRPYFDRLSITTVTSGARFVEPVIVGHAVCGHAHRRNRFPSPRLLAYVFYFPRLGWCCHRPSERTSSSYLSIYILFFPSPLSHATT